MNSQEDNVSLFIPKMTDEVDHQFVLFLRAIFAYIFYFITFFSSSYFYMINFCQFPSKREKKTSLIPTPDCVCGTSLKFNYVHFLACNLMPCEREKTKKKEKTKSLFSHPTIAHQLLITRYHNIAVIKNNPNVVSSPYICTIKEHTEKIHIYSIT